MSQPCQPNILVFMTDDHGQWAARCYGNRHMRTPSIDHLAARGTRLTNAFTPCPVCSPARASFFTGRLPSQHGIHDWLDDLAQDDPVSAGHPGLRGQTTIAQLLQGQAYQTALVGKWHCGGDDKRPQPGFERWFSYYRTQYPHCGQQQFSDQGRRLVQHGRQSALLTDRVIDFLRSRDGRRPFFLFVGYVDTHSPFEGHPERLVEAYRGCRFEDIYYERPDDRHAAIVLPVPASREEHDEMLAQYYAAVTMIDSQIGRVLDELDGRGDLDNTLIVYTSDHGHMNGHHGTYTKGNGTVPQNFYDESIRVPCVLSWPDRLPVAQVCDPMVDHCDLFWTLLEAAGVEPDESTCRQIDSPGSSYLVHLTGSPPGPSQDCVFAEYGNARMVRTTTSKLIKRFPSKAGSYADEFYDLATDPRERTNRIDDPANRSIIASLTQRLEEHFDRYEISERSGRRIDEQPPCNRYQPWDYRAGDAQATR